MFRILKETDSLYITVYMQTININVTFVQLRENQILGESGNLINSNLKFKKIQKYKKLANSEK